METDGEVKEEWGNHYTTYFRQYDPRLGRWWSNDPVVQPGESPYAAMYNNPILFSDPLGNDPGGDNPLDPTSGGGVSQHGGGGGSGTGGGGGTGISTWGDIFEKGLADLRKALKQLEQARRERQARLVRAASKAGTLARASQGSSRGSSRDNYVNSGSATTLPASPVVQAVNLPAHARTDHPVAVAAPAPPIPVFGPTVPAPISVPYSVIENNRNTVVTPIHPVVVGTDEQFAELGWTAAGYLHAMADNHTLGLSSTTVEKPANPPTGYYLGRVIGDFHGLINGSLITGSGAVETGLLGVGAGPTLGASLLLTPVTAAQMVYGSGVIYTSADNLFSDFNAMLSTGGGSASGSPPRGGAERAVENAESVNSLVNGEIVLREFPTSKGTVQVLGEIEISGKTIHLKNIAVYPKGALKFEVGAREVLAIRQGLVSEAKSLGFTQLRITGKRVSGANPGHNVDVTIDLIK